MGKHTSTAGLFVFMLGCTDVTPVFVDEDDDSVSAFTTCEGKQVPLTAAMITASDGDPSKAIDGDNATYWAGSGVDGDATPSTWGWIDIDLGASMKLCRLDAHWYTNGDGRKYAYELHARKPSVAEWAILASGTSASFEPRSWDGDNWKFDPTDVQHLRLYASSTTSAWHSLRELAVFVEDSVTPPPPPPPDDLPPPLDTIYVNTVTELRNALDNSEPGDLIVLRDKTWTFSSYVNIRRSGTEAHPIVVSAETIGGVTITGSAGFDIADVAHVAVRGFDFRFTAGSTAMDIEDSSYVRITRNRFQLGANGQSHWLRLNGTSHHNRIDRNVFANKSTLGNMLTFHGASGVVTHNLIELNHFLNHTYGGSNGGECMRVGWSGFKYSKGYNTIERNLFEKCNGDPEIISVKSSNNAFRYNTFRDNNGALVFRHGHTSEARGNFFIDNEGGIRIYGDDHRIVNNYLEGSTGSGGTRATIAIGSGTVADEPASGAGYDATERCLIAFNTLVDNASHIGIGTDSGHSVGVSNCRIVNNLLVGDAGTFAREVRGYSGFEWSGNMLSGGGATGEFPASGHTRVTDPKLVASGGISHLASDSPARDKATGSYPDITDDFDGHMRTGTFDIGADEYSTATATRRPLLPADVGPGAP